MKKSIVSILAAVLICAAFTGCGNGSESSTPNAPNTENSVAEKSLDERTAAVLDAVDISKNEMVSVKPDSVKTRFGIEEDDVAELSAYICASGAKPDEFGIFRAKDADAAKRIEEALTKRMEHQRKTFQDYTPGEMYKFDGSFVDLRGDVVIYAICADNSTAKELLK